MTRATVSATWDDVPHLTPEQRKAQWDAALPHEREARAKGIPSLGAGKIYPVEEELILVDPFDIPRYWPRAYALDVGWNRTAALWGAWDRDSDTVYLYSEYYAGQLPPAVHASAIRSRGDWMVGAIDPASAGANQKDGTRLIDEYRAEGLDIVPADNAVEAGIFACYQRMSRGGLKVFSTLPNWLTEFRTYRRVERSNVLGTKTAIFKKNDHLMDDMRYLIMTGMAHASIEPDEMADMEREVAGYGRSRVTGY